MADAASESPSLKNVTGVQTSGATDEHCFAAADCAFCHVPTIAAAFKQWDEERIRFS